MHANFITGYLYGLEKGRAEGMADMIAEMRRQGIDGALIDKMVESLNMNYGNN